MSVSESAPLQELRRGINFALAPIRETLAQGTRSVTSVITAVTEIDRLRRENVELSERVERMADELDQLAAVRHENERLSRLLETRATLKRETIAAEVVARQSTQFERVITLDRGGDSGVELGDAVLSEGGALAGTIIEVGSNHATARLISDTRSLVIGIDSASRSTGEVIGRLSAPLAMGNIPATDRVEVGDIIVTAGISLGREFRSFYPRGLLIGRVVDVLMDPGAIVQTAFVEPAARLDHLETVLVITDYQAPVPLDPGASPEPADAFEDEDALVEDELLEPEPDMDATAEPTRRPRPRRSPSPSPDLP